MPIIKLGEPLPAQIRARVAPLRAMNSSTLVFSRALLRERGLGERYASLVEPAAREALDALPSGVWAPTALARAHFEACDALDLDERVQLEMGYEIAGRLHGAVLKLALRLAGAAGATPLFLAGKAVKVWSQRNDGGDMLLVHTAEREARVELLGYTLADIASVRVMWRAVLAANARLLMTRARVTEIAEASDATTLAYRMAW